MNKYLALLATFGLASAIYWRNEAYQVSIQCDNLAHAYTKEVIEHRQLRNLVIPVPRDQWKAAGEAMNTHLLNTRAQEN